jgi:DNA helicase-4
MLKQILHALKKRKDFPHGVPQYLLAEPIPGNPGNITPLHIAAEHGTLGTIPKDWISGDSLLIRDAKGRTSMHHAMRAGMFGRIPLRLLTEATLSVKIKRGVTVVDEAFRNGMGNLVPKRYHSLSEYHTTFVFSEALREENFEKEEIRNVEMLAKPPDFASEYSSCYHWLAETGKLHLLPPECIPDSCLRILDKKNRSPIHAALETHGARHLPKHWIDPKYLARKDRDGRTPFHILAEKKNLGDAPLEYFDEETLLFTDGKGRSVADIIEKHGNTELLPGNLQWMSRKRVLARIRKLLEHSFFEVDAFWRGINPSVVPSDEQNRIVLGFVSDWARTRIGIELDKEQAVTVAASNSHIQVTARAGSGKTRCLVARVLFHIMHCGVDPKRILVLAFNRKAVSEIRGRISKHLDEDRHPHVLTFHALAYRIVNPSEELLYDEGESDEGKRLSQLIQDIILRQIRNGTLEDDIRRLMRIQWESSLARIVKDGFDLSKEEFIELRERMHDLTLDGRRVASEVHKWIGDFLLIHGFRYSYKRSRFRKPGSTYTPEFWHSREDGRSFIIETEQPQRYALAARDAFLQSDSSSNVKIIDISGEELKNYAATEALLSGKLSETGIRIRKISKEDLWEKIKDRKINEFTIAVQQFIGRCQKNCIWPAELEALIEQNLHSSKIQKLFWRVAHGIFLLYEKELESGKTDFDRLMLEASEQLARGAWGFHSKAGKGDLRKLEQILIDEFQDFSLLFDKLRTEIFKKCPNARFFCVGDDWQAINRFAGSALKYFREFEAQFSPCRHFAITTNYRSCREVVDTGNHVMAGDGKSSQPKADAPSGEMRLATLSDNSDRSPQEQSVEEQFGSLGVEILRLAQKWLSTEDGKATVVVLARRRSIATSDFMLDLPGWERKLRKFLPEDQRRRLSFSTVHSFKGREATAVILHEPEVYPMIHPNSVFDTIFGDTFESICEDERRLFYVGVTRAERALYLLPKDLSEKIPFLEHLRFETIKIDDLESNLLLGDEVHVRLASLPSLGYSETEGTFPIKDLLKEQGFGWNPKQKFWFKRVPVEELSDVSAYREFLENAPWISKAHGIEATFTTDERVARFAIAHGKVRRTDAVLSKEQQQDLDDLPEELREKLGELLETLHLGHSIPWPEVGYEFVDAAGHIGEGILEIAWPDFKVGIALEDDEVGAFRQNGWKIFPAKAVTESDLIGLFGNQ